MVSVHVNCPWIMREWTEERWQFVIEKIHLWAVSNPRTFILLMTYDYAWKLENTISLLTLDQNKIAIIYFELSWCWRFLHCRKTWKEIGFHFNETSLILSPRQLNRRLLMFLFFPIISPFIVPSFVALTNKV